MRVKEYEEFKRKELIGDGLLSFLVREMICTDWSMRITQRIKATTICSNEYLIYCAVKADIKPFEGDECVYPNKKFANKMEALLYDTYLDLGIEGAREWIRLIIISQFDNFQHRHTEETGINFFKSKIF